MKKKDKLKETARPKTWIWEAYFHLFFLVIHSFMFALFFSLREMERDMPFLSACASLWRFSGLLFCMGPAQSRAQAQRSSRVDYPDWCQHFDGATDHSCKRPLPSVARTLHALISVAKQPMPRLNQQEQLPYRRHRREQYIQTCYHDTGQNVSLSADNQHAVRRLAAQSISTSLGLNVSRVTGVIFLSVKSLRSSSALQTEATTRSVSELNVWPAIIHSQTIRVQMNELWSSRLAKYWISTSAGVTMSM